MSTTIDELSTQLKEIPGLKVLPGADSDSVRFVFPTEKFVDPDSHDQHILVVVRLEENGEYLKVYVPHAMEAKGRHADDLLKACMMIQYKTKLIQFEYDDSDGEIRPIVEWPIEDGTVTTKQLLRGIRGVVALVDGFYPVLELARTKGKIDMSLGPF